MHKKRHCSRCDRDLPATSMHFGANYSRKDNLDTYCKTCRSQLGKERRESAKYKEKYKNSKKLVSQYKTHKDREYTPLVISVLQKSPHLSNRSVAIRTGAPYDYVLAMRNRLEHSKEIPFADRLYDEETGKWRRRLIRKEQINPWGRTPLTYFVQCQDDGPIKIGRTDNMRRRLKDLQLSNPYPLNVLRTLSGLEHEQQLHERFEKHRLHGEWFKPDPEILKFISEHEEIQHNEHVDLLEKHRSSDASDASDRKVTKNQNDRESYHKKTGHSYKSVKAKIEPEIDLAEEILEIHPGNKKAQVEEWKARTMKCEATFDDRLKRLANRSVITE